MTNESTNSPTTPLTVISKIFPTIMVLGIMGAGWYAVHELNAPHDGHSEEAEEAESAVASSVMELPDGKVEAGQFSSEAVSKQSVQHVHVVSGRIQYDELHHIEVKTPMAGILTEIQVKPGDQVQAGQLLATLNSPEIGRARAEVLKHQTELSLAQRIFKRESEIAENLKAYLQQLDATKDLKQLDDEFSSKQLGTYRQNVLSAYSRMLLAEQLMESVRPLAGTGSVSGKTIREREAELQISQVQFRSAREQALFESSQAMLEAEAARDDATRMLKVAHQQLESLLGYDEDQVSMDNEASLSRVEIRAPFAGTIEARYKADNERILPSEVLFVLADTKSLYVSADIRENDWPAVSLQPGTEIKVDVPALPDQQFTATVHYVGREVIPETNSVPLVATINNEEGALRPGMFVRVSLPVGANREAISVHPESILTHGDEQFVFVQLDDNQFQKVDVKTGLASDQWIEVTEGLAQGQRVVQNGAFLLKSEMLLEGEAE